MTALEGRLFARARSTSGIWFRFAIDQRLSPAFTAYVAAGVTSETGCCCTTEAAGVLGRVGVKRMPGLEPAYVAGASGLNEFDAGSGAVPEGSDGGADATKFGSVTMGAA